MNKFTEDELTSKIKELVLKHAAEQGGYISQVEDIDISVLKNNDDEVLFEVPQMYNSPCECSFKLLKDFSDLFGTDNIDKYDDISNGGCPTCDYYSSYGFAIRVWA